MRARDSRSDADAALTSGANGSAGALDPAPDWLKDTRADWVANSLVAEMNHLRERAKACRDRFARSEQYRAPSQWLADRYDAAADLFSVYLAEVSDNDGASA